jgi:ATP-dependent helicase/DNAse subunit B
MRFLSGPAGSGKSSFVLDRFRAALRAGDDSVRLLVPTATLEQHLQNSIAKEGFVFRRSLIQTFSRFIEPWAEDLPQVSDPVVYLIVEEAARRVNRPEFARVAQMPGFCAALARTIEEFSSAGCGSARLAGALPDAPLAEAFLAVYREVDHELERRGLALRARRLERAAERIAADGLAGIRTVLLDGFHALPDPELAVLRAMDRHAEVVVVQQAPAAVVDGYPFRPRPSPVLALVRASRIEREVEEIARRILDQAAGRPFREMAVVVRDAETYVPLIETTMERFGIPARFYFDRKLEEHAVARFLTGAVDAMLGGWDYSATLGVLRLMPGLADSDELDRFDFAVRERIPNAGLEGLRALAGGLAEELERLAVLEEWRGFSLTPPEWARRFRDLRALFRPVLDGALNGALVMQWRSQAAVLELFDEALDEAALALGESRAMGIVEFWSAVKSVLRIKPLRLNDGRHDVVHVMSAHEARQWVLPVVFVCGLVEKQFPKLRRQNVFFPEAAIARLNAGGIRVRTAAEWESEERALFDAAISRATLLTVLSYPEFDSRGDRNLPSLFLEELNLEAAAGLAPGITDHKKRWSVPQSVPHNLIQVNRVSPTGLESFLQCPFQYFGRHTLRLKAAPPRPEKRLDPLRQGEIVHRVLAAWWTSERDIRRIFEEVFAQQLAEKQIPPGYHTERLRNAMLADLEAFAEDRKWRRDGWQSRVEQKFLMALGDGAELSGKIDRLDIAPDGRAYVLDYKYSATQRVKKRRTDANLLQAPLYALAAERELGVEVAGVFYVGVKGEVLYVGWSDSGLLDSQTLEASWIARAEERAVEALEAIRSGRIEPAPADTDNCRFCECRDACRIEIGAQAEMSEGMEA